jgi:hypothetical protein
MVRVSRWTGDSVRIHSVVQSCPKRTSYLRRASFNDAGNADQVREDLHALLFAGGKIEPDARLSFFENQA